MQARRRRLSREGEMEHALHLDMLHLQRMALLYKRHGLLEQAAAVYETLHQLLEEANSSARNAIDSRNSSATNAIDPSDQPPERADEGSICQSTEIRSTLSQSSENSDLPSSNKGGRFIRLIRNQQL